VEKSIHHIEPKLGEGIYIVKDVAKILHLDYQKTYRWMVGYWGTQGGLDEDTQYTFGEIGNRAINFFSLIEFYTFFKLREKGISSIQIRKLHGELSRLFNTSYPFAIANDFFIENRKTKKFIYYDYLETLIKLDKKHQFSLGFVEKFLEKIEFEDNLAVRFFPLTNSKNVVVDPQHQFGQPIISGTNIKTQTIFSLYNGGETLENISILYNISKDKVDDAIAFQKAAA
jgi:uncharacterized protein (DUF433 family)